MKQNGMDVVNCIDQGNNHMFLEKSQFLEGSGKLNFYLYNWMCPQLTKSDISIVMI